MRRRQQNLIFLELSADFARFWAVFPRRVHKVDALKAWAQLQPSQELVDRMVDALEWQRQQPSWTKEAGTYVPYPASWLRGRRWEDEPFEDPCVPLSRLTPFERARRAGLK